MTDPRATHPLVTFDEDTHETTLEFWSGDRKVTIHVDPGPDGGISAVKVWGPDIHDEMEYLDLGGSYLFAWLRGRF